MTKTENSTEVVYFAARCGSVMSEYASDRRVVQMYVNRNNAAAARHGDDSKPYSMLAYVVPGTK